MSLDAITAILEVIGDVIEFGSLKKDRNWPLWRRCLWYLLRITRNLLLALLVCLLVALILDWIT
ncbi:hypothetical protein Q6A51_22210 [Pseudomonas sp. KFB-139]|uniref:Uncharacterized protein n=1 Tax=Pseudomonas serbiensis TaxID=3064350 RepID=A0ABT9CXG6_9PSED|nr:hypothetical protein [Pseudomonas sp. KFB-138]MDO7929493.1 hypothetical protein [Pseudomonas sp. KFB-138]